MQYIVHCSALLHALLLGCFYFFYYATRAQCRQVVCEKAVVCGYAVHLIAATDTAA
jgi:hypothetical protein